MRCVECEEEEMEYVEKNKEGNEVWDCPNCGHVEERWAG